MDSKIFSERPTSYEEQTMAYGIDLQTTFARVSLYNDPDFSKQCMHLGPLGAGINLGYQSWREELLLCIQRLLLK